MFKKNSYKLDKIYTKFSQKKLPKKQVFWEKFCYIAVKPNKKLSASLTLV
ncbi:hypothetical protein N0824_00210 [Microcystis sp. 0824]|nr:hypothetical protein N0824_00210 [Microcystis sp. 0824]